VPHAVSVLLDQELVALNRAVGELRRRNLPIASIAVGPTDVPGVTRLTVVFDTDEATADMTVKKLHKLSGVRGVVRFLVDEGVARELALVKVRAPHQRYAELLDVCERFTATVVEETPKALVVQVAGTGSFILAFLRALEEFGILEVARSGSVTLPPLPPEATGDGGDGGGGGSGPEAVRVR
jgi:acetolactate synthase I/III small subunit